MIEKFKKIILRYIPVLIGMPIGIFLAKLSNLAFIIALAFGGVAYYITKKEKGETVSIVVSTIAGLIAYGFVYFIVVNG
tara:strand:+ start:274 stop:510 length:237 start_codon:yes stop_codon:yes gene_type:complete